MAPEHVWSPWLQELPLAGAPEGPLAVVAPHPDDETLGCGGLVAEVAARGHVVTVVVCTDGEAAYPVPGLAEVRRRECVAALGALGVPADAIRFLGLPDGQLFATLPALVEELRGVLASASTVAAPWVEDDHPDHRAVAVATSVAAPSSCEIWSFPIWAWHRSDPDGLDDAHPVALALDPTRRQAKADAVACYRSQTTDRFGEPILPIDVLEHFARDVEVFVVDHHPDVTSPAFFDAVHAGDIDLDPWGFASEPYEQRRYRTLMGALGPDPVDSCLELGCSVGVFTAQLAARATRLDAIDHSAVAVERARRRVAELDGVDVHVADVRRFLEQAAAEGRQWELVTLCEIGYYFDTDGCAELASLVARAAWRRVLVSHWTGSSDDHRITGDEVHHIVATQLEQAGFAGGDVDEPGFRVGVWTRT